jgi:hypothetical protein
MAITPNDLAITSIPQSLTEHQELLDRLETYAAVILSKEQDRLRRSQLLRLYAEEIGCPVNEKTAATILAKAQGLVVGLYQPVHRGERMDCTPTPWVWEGIVMAGTFNLLVAPPKVGKSALMVGMLAAWWRGDDDYLGQPLHGNCPPVFIVGTDQPQNDWFTLFKREGLVDQGEHLGGPIEMLWHTGAPLHLTNEGIEHLGELAAANPGAFFLVDSYHACVSPLGIDEATSAFDGPARDLAQALAPHQATLVMIHHTNKSVAGGNATNASRGSNALPAAASLTILMNWLKAPAEGQTQSDYRVVLKTQGRAKGATVLVELKDDGWVAIGDGEKALQLEALEKASVALQGRPADAFDYIADRWALGEFPVSGIELANHLNIAGNKANRAIQGLVHQGLVKKVGLTTPGLDGGRPSGLFAPVIPLPPEGVKNVDNVQNPPLAHELRGFSPFIRLERVPGGGGVFHPSPGTPVERLIDASWRNGWVVVDGSDPHSITVAKTGQSNFRIRNLRWEIDVRLATTAYPTHAADSDPDLAPQEVDPVTDRLRPREPHLSLVPDPATHGSLDHEGDQYEDRQADGDDQCDQGWAGGLGIHRHEAPWLYGNLPADW